MPERNRALPPRQPGKRDTIVRLANKGGRPDEQCVSTPQPAGDRRAVSVSFQAGPPSDFRVRSTLGVALAGLFLLTPFSINNFLQSRYFLGIGSMAIMCMLGLSAWGSLRGRYYPWLTFAGLVPAITFFLFVSLRDQGVIGALWCFPAAVSFYFMLPEGLAWTANLVFIAITLPQSWAVLEHPIAARVTATLLAVSVFSAIFVRVITSQQRRLQAQAVTDPLTGLSNRAPLRSTLEQAFEQSRRTGTSMTLVTLDLDEFKSINDTLGHDAGDAVLRGVGELLRRRFRRADKVFRLGGEEFLVLLYGTDSERGGQVAEELRRAVAALNVIPDRSISASIGVATLQPDETLAAWMKRGDENLYRAKTAGRNQVIS